jgi:regulator of protease activity HflC (stomatin/prohibitin superfamily)
MALIETLSAAAVAIVAILLVSRLVFLRIVIYDYQKGLLYRAGRLVRTLDAGLYWILRSFAAVQVVDVRSRLAVVAGQEILSADNLALRITLALRYRVTRPDAAMEAAQSFADALYLEAQLVLRDLGSAVPAEALLERRGELGAQVRTLLEPKASMLGVELETVGVKDVTFPASLKQIFAQVVEARKAAEAALERARGETASLRQLANAARMLDGNPSLVTMKTLQAVGNGKNTIVLGIPGSMLPIDRTSGERRAGPQGDTSTQS